MGTVGKWALTPSSDKHGLAIDGPDATRGLTPFFRLFPFSPAAVCYTFRLFFQGDCLHGTLRNLQ